jgi:hypothetical protein
MKSCNNQSWFSFALLVPMMIVSSTSFAQRGIANQTQPPTLVCSVVKLVSGEFGTDSQIVAKESAPFVNGRSQVRMSFEGFKLVASGFLELEKISIQVQHEESKVYFSSTDSSKKSLSSLVFGVGSLEKAEPYQAICEQR